MVDRRLLTLAAASIVIALLVMSLKYVHFTSRAAWRSSQMLLKVSSM
jgi:hypothetical protein